MKTLATFSINLNFRNFLITINMKLCQGMYEYYLELKKIVFCSTKSHTNKLTSFIPKKNRLHLTLQQIISMPIIRHKTIISC